MRENKEQFILYTIAIALVFICLGLVIGAYIGNINGFKRGYTWSRRVDICYSIGAKPLRSRDEDRNNNLLFSNSILCQKRNTIYVFRGKPRHYNLITQFEAPKD